MGSIGIIAELEDSIELIHEKFANRDDMTADQEQKTYDSIGENIMKIIKSVKSNEREFKAVKGKMEKKAFIVAKQKIDQIRIKIQEIEKIGQKTRNEIHEKREQEGSEDKEGKGKPVKAKACSKGNYGVFHQYDNGGKGACGCVPMNDPCRTGEGPKGPQCIPAHKCGNQPKAGGRFKKFVKKDMTEKGKKFIKGDDKEVFPMPGKPVKAKKCSKGKYGVFHQYDNGGKGACGCEPMNDPCRTAKGPKGPQCISAAKCGNQPRTHVKSTRTATTCGQGMHMVAGACKCPSNTQMVAGQCKKK